MTDFKQRAQGINPSIEPRNVAKFGEKYDSIYEALAIISARSRQLSSQIKEELHSKLEEFAVSTENLEEIHENKEQIEISKVYERLPNPVIIALHEFMDEKLGFRYPDDQMTKERQRMHNAEFNNA
jgi:DNA-directed RNA polymerase subunit K/omega